MSRRKCIVWWCAGIAAAFVAGELPAIASEQDTVIELGSRRELFVDNYLVERLIGTNLKLHQPQLAPRANTPRPNGHYTTILKDGARFRQYYRGDKKEGVDWRKDGWEAYHNGEVTLYAESSDGVNWNEPDLGLYRVERYPQGNVILADHFLVNHNFSPFIDMRPDVPIEQRYKALGGLQYPLTNWEGWGGPDRREELRQRRGHGGLKALTSPDGIHWTKMQEAAVIPEQWGSLDSQNVSFWSTVENCYVCYFRTIENELRSVSRTTSDDFIHWSEPVAMNANLADEELYTNGTHPYFRAPHIYIALPTRFQAHRGSTTDIVFMTTRGSNSYDRTFKEAFIRPGLDPAAWKNRSNYAAQNVVQTSSTEMSIFVLGDRRFVLRLDGFASVNAPWCGGEVITKPFRFTGKELEINYSTSAAGEVRIEIQDLEGRPMTGFALDDCPSIVGDEIERIVAWKLGSNVSNLAGKPVRLRIVMQDADLFSIRFR